MDLQGHWEGKLIDVTGVNARLGLDIGVRDNAVSGEFTVAFLPDPDDVCRDVKPDIAIRGEIKGEFDGEDRIRLHYDIPVNDEPTTVSLDARVVSADPHAKLAMLGRFAVEQAPKLLTLEGGSVMLWQYADTKGRANDAG